MVSNENFDEKALIYDKYRPTYSSRYIHFLSCIGINNTSLVADIGAGTGKHSVILADLAQEVYCIEPNREMLSICENHLAERKNTRFLCSVAEAVDVSDNYFHYITVAQAFHMLEQKKCKKEFARILKPEGKIILTWQSKNENTPLFKETEKVLRRFCPSYCRNIHAPSLTPYSYEDFFEGGTFDFFYFHDDHKEVLDEETFIGRTLSASYSLRNSDSGYEAYNDALHTVFCNHSHKGVIDTALNTVVCIGNL